MTRILLLAFQLLQGTAEGQADAAQAIADTGSCDMTGVLDNLYEALPCGGPVASDECTDQMSAEDAAYSLGYVSALSKAATDHGCAPVTFAGQDRTHSTSRCDLAVTAER